MVNEPSVFEPLKFYCKMEAIGNDKRCFLCGHRGINVEVHVKKSGPEIIIKFFELNLAEHEILNAHKYKILEIQHLSGSDKPRMLFILFINVGMPIVVGILIFTRRKIFKLS